MPRRSGAFVIAGALGLWSAPGLAQSATPADTGGGGVAPVAAPPPLDTPYVQYGAALTTEVVAGSGGICCILGSGGGVVARLGRRSAGPWYFGAAYELSKQDPSSFYRFATLQQARAEARYYFDTGRDVYPYLEAGSGAAAYGDEWQIDTYGPMGTFGVGVEAQVSRRTVVGLSLAYRALVFNKQVGIPVHATEPAYESGASFVQIVGIALSLEERVPIVRELPSR
jgi:hypothetical protein